MSLSEPHQMHRRHLLSLRCSEGTADGYCQTLTGLERYTALQGCAPDVSAINKALLQGLVLHLCQRGLAPGGERATMRGIRATLCWKPRPLRTPPRTGQPLRDQAILLTLLDTGVWDDDFATNQKERNDVPDIVPEWWIV